jgi:hypothetical protein
MVKEVVKVKLNKETIEASLQQIDYLKLIKRDQMIQLCKLFDGKVTAEDIDEFYKLFKSLDTEDINLIPVSQMGTCLRILQQMPTDNEVALLLEQINPKKEGEDEEKKSKKKSASAKKPPPKGKTTGKKSAKSAKSNAESEEEDKIDFYKYILGE